MNKIKFIEDFVIFVIFFTISMAFMPLYIYGDQEFYRKVYDGLANKDNILNAFSFYKDNLGASEVVHFLISISASKLGLDKDIVMSLSNGVLFLLAYKLCCKLGAYRAISFFVVISNYYLYVMAFSAERLKFGFIFLFLFLFLNVRFFIYMCILSHFQMGLVFLGGMIPKSLGHISRIFFNGMVKVKNAIYFLFFCLFLILIFFYSNLTEKVYIYIENNNFTPFSLLKVLLLCSLSFICMSKKHRELAIPILLFLVGASFLLGTDRILILMYFVAMFFCIQYKRGVNIFVIFTVLYYSMSSLIFLYNISIYGDGFNL